VKDTYVFHFNGSPEEYVTTFQHYYGPTMNAFAGAEQNGKTDQLKRELVALFESKNEGTATRTVVPASFMRVIVSV
jgi:hypothetical protein